MAIVARILNVVALLVVCGVLLFVFYWQLVWNELPCPLCLVQRMALVGVGFGFLLNVRYGSSESHFGVIVASALVGGAAAGRQMLQHIVPGTGAFGSTLYDYHLYTLAFVLFAATLAVVAALLFIEAQFVEGVQDFRPSNLTLAVGWLFVLIVLMNALAALLQCGFGPCPANPTGYELLGG